MVEKIDKSHTGAKVQSENQDDVWLHSACSNCVNSDCPIIVHRVNGVVVKIEGDPDNPHNYGKICAKGHAGIMSLYDPYRAKTPLKRTNPEKGIGVDPKWQPISWEEALTTVAAKLKEVRKKDSRRLFVGSFDHNVMHQVIWPWCGAYGTPNQMLAGGAWYCGPALHTALYHMDAQFHSEIDIDFCDYTILFGNQMGGNAGSLSTTMGRKIADARMRGMKLVVVDPILTNIAAKADRWLPIRPGTDGALALALLNVLVNELGIYDAEFLGIHTNAPYLVRPDGLWAQDAKTKKPLIWDNADKTAKPFDAEIKSPALDGTYTINGAECRPAFALLKEHLKQYTPEKVQEITTIAAQTIREVAKEYGEAAKIGAKIVVDGKELPFRPVATNQNRGANAHKGGTQTALAIQLLNQIVGAIYVPGGHMGLNVVGPSKYPWSWQPEASEDGLILTPVSRAFQLYDHTYIYDVGKTLAEPSHVMPGVTWPPSSPYFRELFPIGLGETTMWELTLSEPEKYNPPYKPEMMLLSRCNIMMGRTNPEIMEKILKNVPFLVYFAQQIDETAEMADIVLPDAHILERLDFCPQMMNITESPATGYWYFGIRQPIVEPAGEARPWREVMLELADRAGFLPEVYTLLNDRYELTKEHRLDIHKKYTWPEIVDRYARSLFGEEHSLDWFKKNGYLTFKRSVDEMYPGPSFKARWPVYFENLLRAGTAVKNLQDKVGISMVDTSQYVALLDWQPCPSYTDKSTEYDLYAINYKLPFHFFSHSTQNPWLNELGEHHIFAYDIMINTETARRKGIRDGDIIWVESQAGKVQGKVKLTECVHPEVLGIAGNFGSWARGKPVGKGKGVHWNALVPLTLKHIDAISSNLDACPKVKVYKGESSNG